MAELDLLIDGQEDLLGIYSFHRNLLVVLMGNLVDTFIILLERLALEVGCTFQVDLEVLLALVVGCTFLEHIVVSLDTYLVAFLKLEVDHIPFGECLFKLGFLLEVDEFQHLGVLHLLKVVLDPSYLIIYLINNK